MSVQSCEEFRDLRTRLSEKKIFHQLDHTTIKAFDMNSHAGAQSVYVDEELNLTHYKLDIYIPSKSCWKNVQIISPSGDNKIKDKYMLPEKGYSLFQLKDICSFFTRN